MKEKSCTVRFIIFFLIFSVISVIYANSIKANNGVIEVDSKIYFVSPDGNDSYTGTLPNPTSDGKDGPFRTIQKARDTVRKQIAQGMSSDIIVMLRGGNYYINSTLSFDWRDSGRDGYKVVYRNYPGEEPVIIGGQPIKNWEHYKGNIYKAKIDPTWTFHTLYENWERATLARHPNEGYFRVAKISDSPKKQFIFFQEDVPQISDTANLQVFIWPGGPKGYWNWVSEIINVKEVDYEKNVITLSHETIYELGAGSRYFVQRSLDLLDSPGEFYLDERTGTLYYWPRELPIEEQTIIAPKVKRVIEVRGSPDNPARNIRFEGLTIRCSDLPEEFTTWYGWDALIYLENVENIEIKYCRIMNAGLHGVCLGKLAQNNTVYGNLVYDIGHTGIILQGLGRTIKYINKHNQIINNHIHHVGQIIRHGDGIILEHSGNNIVSHNRIHDCPRHAISLHSCSPSMIIGETIDGIFVTRENAKDFAHTRNNNVSFNDLSDAMKDSQDGGVINTWGTGTGNLIYNNLIHDIEIPFTGTGSFGFGLRLDDASDNFTITKNIIIGLRSGGGSLWCPVHLKGVGNRFFNNIVANNDAEKGTLGSHEYETRYGVEPNRELIIEKNIFYNSGDNIYHFDNWAENRFSKADYNIFYNENGSYGVSGVPDANNLEEWKQILDGRYDRHSIVADPLFMDPENGDYRLRYDSPAYALGFEDPDFENIGLKADFPFADPNDPLDKIFVKAENDNKAWTILFTSEEVQLYVFGRTKTGYVADLTDATITYSTDNTNIVSVNSEGVVTAKSEGVAKIRVSVTKDGVTKEASFYIIVKHLPTFLSQIRREQTLLHQALKNQQNLIENIQRKNNNLMNLLLKIQTQLSQEIRLLTYILIFVAVLSIINFIILINESKERIKDFVRKMSERGEKYFRTREYV